jgi:stage V sporulation protein B
VEPSPDTATKQEADGEMELVVRRAGRGGIAVATAKVYFIFVGLVQQILLPRVLGASGYGGLSRVFSFTSIAYNSVVSTSIQASSRAVARAPLEQKPYVIRSVLKLHALAALPIGLLVWISAPIAGHWLNAVHLIPALRIMGGVFFFYALYSPIVGVLNGQQRFLSQAGLDICFATLRTIALITGASWFVRHNGHGVEGAVWGFVLVSGIITLLAVFIAGIGKAGASSLKIGQHGAFVLPLFAGQILLNTLLQLDITLLGRFAADAAERAGVAAATADTLVASYRATQLFSFLPYQLLLSITFILFPLLAKAHREGKHQDVSLFVSSGIRIALIVAGAIVSVTAGIPGALLRMVFAPNIAEPAVRSMGLLTMGFGSFAIFGILTTALTSLQRERTSAAVTALAVFLVVAIAFALVQGQPFGVSLLWRMAIATSTGLILATLTAGYFVFRLTGSLVSASCLVRVSAALFTAVGLGRAIAPIGLISTVAVAVFLVALYLGVLVLLRELNRSDIDRLTAVVRRQQA